LLPVWTIVKVNPHKKRVLAASLHRNAV
jgi:hypothetical protein